jgi:hypothetical protein
MKVGFIGSLINRTVKAYLLEEAAVLLQLPINDVIMTLYFSANCLFVTSYTSICGPPHRVTMYLFVDLVQNHHNIHMSNSMVVMGLCI